MRAWERAQRYDLPALYFKPDGKLRVVTTNGTGQKLMMLDAQAIAFVKRYNLRVKKR